MLDHFAHEYCIYRGIVDSATVPSSGISLTNNSRDCTLDHRHSRLSDSETLVNNVDTECVQDANANSLSVKALDVEMRSASEVISSHEDCSTSNVNHSQNCFRRIQRNRYHLDGQRRKRWRGRVNPLGLTPDANGTGHKLGGEQIVNLHTNKVARILGKVENSDGFLRIALYQSDRNNKRIRKIPAAAANVNESKDPLTDPTLLYYAFKKHRIYLISRKELEGEKDATKGRDVFNEKPLPDELLAVSDLGKAVTTSLPDSLASLFA